MPSGRWSSEIATDPDVRRSILRRYAVSVEDKIGEGDEAEAYALGAHDIIKIFKPVCHPETIERRRTFYDMADARTISFAISKIFDHKQMDGVHYTVEARIAGTSLTDALPRFDATRRRDALLAYAATATEISEIVYPLRLFGEIVSVPPLVADSWSDFVLARVRTDLSRSLPRLASTIDHPHRAIDRIESLLAKRSAVEPRLVHGDYYPANVMADAQGRIVGVIDFGGLTLSGDPRLDAAASVLHLTGLDGITESDRQVVLGHLRNRGLTDGDLALYRLFYAVRFLDTPRAGLRRWCLATIQAAC